MNRRKKHFARPADSPNIEWLKHRKGYPPPDEREQIIQMRKELASELLMLMFSHPNANNPRMRMLAKKYGEVEITRALEMLQQGLKLPSIIADDAYSYREYRKRYGQFGEGLKFLSSKELATAYLENAEALAMEEDSEAARLLLIGWRDWDDITPPAIPSRPADFSAPAPATYPAPINELLEWGDDLSRELLFEDEAEKMSWKKSIPALTRMALDLGLVNGWSSEKASWAPWHAIHALGSLQAWESAPALASLADLENDWLSDHLPHIWADMGKDAEPSLWMILETTSASAKQRGLAAESLQMLSSDNEALQERVIEGFEKMLRNETSFNPTLNAYLLHSLAKMEALDEVEETALSAIENGRVDEEIFTEDDLYADLEDDDDFDDDEEYKDDDFEDEPDEDQD